MTAVLLPPLRVAVALPAVRAAVLLVVVGPAFAAWSGTSMDVSLRLRLVGVAAAVVAAMTWADPCEMVAAPTPTGLPAVRHGRALVVVAVLASAWLLAGAVASGSGVAFAAISLQTAGLALLLTAVVGGLARGRDGEGIGALPVPVLLVVAVLLARLPEQLSLLRSEPGAQGWPDEQTRWIWVGAVALVYSTYAARDPSRR